ncbi:MAG TPA: hypothetical protein VK472_03485 [Allosphingosinicella sp.]|nr:hypothetical protein [Allosphingosinicella sp.]
MQFQLQRRVERFLKSSRVPPTRFGRDSVRDPRLVFDMRQGRQLRPATARRLNAYLDEQEKLSAG